MRGWQVPAYPLTGTYSKTPVQRVLVKLGFTRELADLLIQHMQEALEYFKKHPVGTPLSAEEGASYSHL